MKTSRPDNVLNDLVERFEARLQPATDMPTVEVPRNQVRKALRHLQEAWGMDLLVDLTAVDWLGRREERFEVVYHLARSLEPVRLRVKTRVPEEDPTVESVGDLFRSALWLEREVYDLFGIVFTGHPNLKRILLWEGFPGHPLRKDYPLRKRPPLPEPI